MLAPKGFTQQIAKPAYVAAHKTAQTKIGILRFTAPLMLVTVALSLGGVYTMYIGAGRLSYLITGEVMLALSAALCIVLLCLPRIAARRAERGYETFAKLCDPSQVVFTSDDMTIKGERLSRRVEYAKTRLCIETKDRFVIITDDDAVVILEKACFTDADTTTAFLRDVFARWYTKK